MEEGLKRMPHRAQSPDPSPCDLFLFDYLEGKLADKPSAMPEELCAEVDPIIPEIRSDMISRVFLIQQERFPKWTDMRGNDIGSGSHFR
jgi:hypothetical protein